MRKVLPVVLLFLCINPELSFSQNDSSTVGRVIPIPSRLFSRIQAKTADLDRRLTRQTEVYLEKMANREQKLQKKLSKIDPAAAEELFANSKAGYAALQRKIRSDTGTLVSAVKGNYNPYVDSLRVSMDFLSKNPSLFGDASALQTSIGRLRQLQAKMQDAGQAQNFVRQRDEQIKQLLSRYTSLPSGIQKEYEGLNQDLFYYTHQVSQVKEMLTQPDQLEEKVLRQLNKLSAFQNFMRKNSQLAAMFGQTASPNSGTPVALAGLQTRDQIGQQIQEKLGISGANAPAVLQNNLQSARQQLDQLKDKVDKFGTGGGSMDMSDFKPNDAKTRSFWKRLQVGTDLQTSRNNYMFPVVTDIGASLAYKLNNSNTVGVSSSFKLGWGDGIHHIAFSGQGVGLRSFIDIKIHRTLSASGGLEYNYTTPITSFQQIQSLHYWTQSGLLGICKTVSMKNRIFKNTKVSLLWDFLSYQQVPRTQPLLFRMGYVWR